MADTARAFAYESLSADLSNHTRATSSTKSFNRQTQRQLGQWHRDLGIDLGFVFTESERVQNFFVLLLLRLPNQSSLPPIIV